MTFRQKEIAMRILKLMCLGCLVWIGLGTSVCALDLAKVGMFAAGFASGTVFHEVGALGGDGDCVGRRDSWFYFQGVEVGFNESDPDRRNEKLRPMILGGYVAQSLATEVIINQKTGMKMTMPGVMGV